MSWLPVAVTSQPASEPVTALEIKANAKIDGSDSDTWITDAIADARVLVEQYTGTRIITQTVMMRCSAWSDLDRLPVAPIASVTSITYLDADGAEQTLSTDVYETVLIGLDPHIRLKINQSWPAIRNVSDAIRVTAVAGASAAEKNVKRAIIVTVTAWEANRNGDRALTDGAMALLSNTRRF